MDWRAAHVTSGSGGSGPGARGGDIGSHNSSASSTKDSNNDNSVRHRIQGNDYGNPVDQGDTYSGPINNSVVGGRGNRNRVINNTDKSGQGHEKLSKREIELNERIRQSEEKLAAKKERERLKRLEDKAKRLEEELGKDEDAP